MLSTIWAAIATLIIVLMVFEIRSLREQNRYLAAALRKAESVTRAARAVANNANVALDAIAERAVQAELTKTGLDYGEWVWADGKKVRVEGDGQIRGPRR